MNDREEGGAFGPGAPPVRSVLSERLLGIVESMAGRVARLVHVDTNLKLSDASMGLLRHWLGIAIRAAALEGARSATKTRAELLPVPPGAVTQLRMPPITTHNNPPKAPKGSFDAGDV